MKRKKKVLVCVIGMIAGACIILGTGYVANTQRDGMGPGNHQMEKVPDAKSGGDSDSKSAGGQQGTPPELPGENNSSSSDKIKRGNPPGDRQLELKFMIPIGIGALIFSVSFLYMLIGVLFQKAVFLSAGKGVGFLLANLVLTAALTFGSSYGLTHFAMKRDTVPSEPGSNSQTASVSASAVKVMEGEEASDIDVASKNTDESAVLVKNGGTAALNAGKISKTGDTSDTENSEFYGINAAVLTQSKSTSNLKNLKITTDAKGSNAVFATGTGAKTYIQDSVINTKSDSSRGLDATYGGYIKGKKLKITTQGTSCAALATDRGEGTVDVSDSSLETNGNGSPVIYSTGDITLKGSSGTANSAQMAVVEGKNSVSVENVKLTAAAKGNRNGADHAGVMIYQSMSGDASAGTGRFTAKNSVLSIDSGSSLYKTAPFFFVTNTDAQINLTNNQLVYGSNILLSVKGTSEWGTSGKNGGNAALTAKKQKLSGDIKVDKISTLTFSLKNKSTYKGTINGNNTAENIVLTLDNTSNLTLTGDSYVSKLNTEDESYSNINFNGYKLYVNGKEIN